MDTLYSRLIEICRDQGIESPTPGDISRICNLSSGRPKQIKDGGRAARLGQDTLTRLVELGYSPAWIQEGKKPKLLSILSSKIPDVELKSDLDDLRADGRDVYSIGKGRPVPVIGNGNGGHLPERVWDDQGYPVGAFDEYAEIATSDQHAFIVRVRGDSMWPKYTPGEYALVEPDSIPDVGDDVLVRLVTGETLIKTLAARSADGVRLSSYNTTEVKFYAHNEVSWMYWVPFPIPAKKIKTRG